MKNPPLMKTRTTSPNHLNLAKRHASNQISNFEHRISHSSRRSNQTNIKNQTLSRPKEVVAYIVLLFLSTTAFSQLPDSLTLAQTIQLAEATGLTAFRAETDRRTTELDYELFRARLRPQLSLDANLPNYQRSFLEVPQPDGTVNFKAVRNHNGFVGLTARQPLAATGGSVFVRTNLQRFDDLESDFKQYNGTPVRVGIDQPLFGFNPWKWERQLTELRYQNRDRAYELARATVRLDAAQLFFQLLSAAQDLRIAETNQTTSAELLLVANERFELGQISQNARLQLELDELSARRNAEAASAALQRATAQLYNYLGMPYRGQTIRPVLPTVPELGPLDADAYVAAALSRHPALLATQTDRLEAQAGLERVRRDHGPQAFLTAAVGLSRGAETLEPIYTDPQAQQFLSLGVNVPLYDGGNRKLATERAQLQLQQTEREADYTLRALENQLRDGVYQLRTAETQLQFAETARQLALRRFDIARQSFVLGALSTTELSIARQERDFAARSFVAALREVWLGKYRLEAVR